MLFFQSWVKVSFGCSRDSGEVGVCYRFICSCAQAFICSNTRLLFILCVWLFIGMYAGSWKEQFCKTKALGLPLIWITIIPMEMVAFENKSSVFIFMPMYCVPNDQNTWNWQFRWRFLAHWSAILSNVEFYRDRLFEKKSGNPVMLKDRHIWDVGHNLYGRSSPLQQGTRGFSCTTKLSEFTE